MMLMETSDGLTATPTRRINREDQDADETGGLLDGEASPKCHHRPAGRRRLACLVATGVALVAVALIAFAVSGSTAFGDSVQGEPSSFNVAATDNVIVSRNIKAGRPPPGSVPIAFSNPQTPQPTSTLSPSAAATVYQSTADQSTDQPTASMTMTITDESPSPSSGPITDEPESLNVEEESLNDQPTPAPSAVKLGCLPDRFDNEEMDLLDLEVNFKRLYPGQFICSKPYDEPTDKYPDPQRYRFGMTDDGDVVWIDTIDDKVKTIFKNINRNGKNIHFSLRTDATMVVQKSHTGEVLWESSPVDLEHPMSHTPRCLSSHDCPYFHLHSDGVLVMNYIAGDGAGWQAKNMFRVYEVEKK